METQNIGFINQRPINIIFNCLVFIIEFTMLISILIFIFFIIKGFLTLEHIPFYGDKEIISQNEFDSIMIKTMLYPMWFGAYIWIFIIIFGWLVDIERKRAKNIFGLVLCFFNIWAMFSSQLAWIID